MKKLFFTALVAVVAIGGAFAGSANKTLAPNPIFDKISASECTEILPCTSIPTATICNIPGTYVLSDCQTSAPAYKR